LGWVLIIEAIFERIIILTCALTYLLCECVMATPTGPFRQSSIRRYFCGRHGSYWVWM